MSHIQTMVCPWWLAFTLNNIFRKMIQNPQSILAPWVRPDQTAADIGCGPGFFTLEMARLVGEHGKVMAVDLQEKMLQIVKRRAEKAGLSNRIQYRQCGDRALGLKEPCDFILAFYMVHEVPDDRPFFKEIKSGLKPGGLFLLVEPKIHVSREEFVKTLARAREAGLRQKAEPVIRFSRAALLAPHGNV